MNKTEEKDYINKQWNSNLELLKESISGFKELTTHTLTFNKEIMMEDFSMTYFKFLARYIKLIKTFNKEEDFNYFYSFEISGEDHIHIHMVINREFTEIEKKQIQKQWNKWQNWDFWNEKGLVINSNKDDLYGVTAYDLRKICKYFTKEMDVIDEDLMKLYYYLYPVRLMNGVGSFSFQGENYEIKNIMDNLKFALIWRLMDFFGIYAPIPKLKEEKEVKVVKDYYEEWNVIFKRSCDKDFMELETALKALKLNSEEEKFMEVQRQINSFMRKGRYVLNPFQLQSLDFKFFLRSFIVELGKSKKSLLFDFFSKFINLETIFVFVIDALVKCLLKDKFLNLPIEKETLNLSNKDKFISESRFKYLLSQIYKYNIFNCFLVHDFLCYGDKKKRDKSFYLFLKEVVDLEKFINLKDFSLELLSIYNSIMTKPLATRLEVLENESFRSLLDHKEFLVQLTLFLNDILQILYGMGFFKEIVQTNLRFMELSPKILTKLLNYKYVSNIEFPNVVVPKNFEPDVTWRNWNAPLSGEKEGGYGGPNREVLDLVHNNNNFITLVNHKKVYLINKMQSLAFKIDYNYLSYLLYLDEDIIKEFTSINFSAFKERHEKQEKTFFTNSQYFLCLEFLVQLRMADLMKRIKFWFQRFMDTRHRLYLTHYPFGFDGSTFLRPIFIFSENVNISLKERLKHFPFFYNYLKNPKVDNFVKHALFKNPFESLIGFDASSQVFQILGALILNEKMLKLTKVLKVEEKDGDLKSGFYEFLLKEFLSQCGDFEAVKDNLIEAYEVMKNKPIEMVSLIAYEVEFRFKKIYEKIDRKWIKEILMTYGYNKSLIELSKTTLYIMFEKDCINEDTWLNYKKIASFLTGKLIKCLDENFKGLSHLRTLFRALSSLGGFLEVGTFINISSSLDYEIQEDYALQYYHLSKEVKVQKFMSYTKEERARLKEKYGVERKGRNLTDRYFIHVDKLDREFDYKKSQNALLPNTTHHIDSHLMFLTIENLFNKNIQVVPIHDSFYVSHMFYKEVKEAYVHAFIKVFSEDLLLILVRNNLFMWRFHQQTWILSDFVKLFKKLSIDLKNLDLKIFLNEDPAILKDLNSNQLFIFSKLRKISQSYFFIKNMSSFDNSRFIFLLQNFSNENILS